MSSIVNCEHIFSLLIILSFSLFGSLLYFARILYEYYEHVPIALSCVIE